MSGSERGASKTPEDEWENRWLRAWRKPDEPELYDGARQLAAQILADRPREPWEPQPGEIRIVRDYRGGVCVHGIDLQVRCVDCLSAPPAKESWWRRLFR